MEKRDYLPLKLLTLSTYEWKIKARVLRKYEKKEWDNEKGKGKLLNIELVDKNGTQI